MLTQTLEHMFTQEVTIERDMASPDAFGAQSAPDWQPLAPSPARLWWWKGSRSTDKSPSNQYARPEATYDETGGDMALPAGTDITTLDRIGAVLEPATGEVVEEGPFRVVAVNRYSDHVELSLERP